jgi:hypothetical protein
MRHLLVLAVCLLVAAPTWGAHAARSEEDFIGWAGETYRPGSAPGGTVRGVASTQAGLTFAACSCQWADTQACLVFAGNSRRQAQMVRQQQDNCLRPSELYSSRRLSSCLSPTPRSSSATQPTHSAGRRSAVLGSFVFTSVAHRIEVVSWKPRAFIYHNFLSDEEAEHMKRLAAPTVSSSDSKQHTMQVVLAAIAPPAAPEQLAGTGRSGTQQLAGGPHRAVCQTSTSSRESICCCHH